MKNLGKMTFRLVVVALILVLALLSACAPKNPTTVCHSTGDPAKPYEALTIDSKGLDEHQGHPNDIIPIPMGGCPTSLVVTDNGKIAICHATNSDKNPYNEITVSINGLNGHGDHENDIIPMPASGCPTTKP